MAIGRVTIHFEVHCETVFGQVVYVVGGEPELGRWNPRKGGRMHYEHPYKWKLQLDLPATDNRPAALKYRYCILHDHQENGGVPHWEPRGYDRELILDKPVRRTNDRWGEGEQVREIPLNIPRLGRLFRSGMPDSEFDPNHTIYEEWKRHGVDVIVCLCTEEEMRRRSGQDLLRRYFNDGYAVIHCPIEDFQTPANASQVANLVERLVVLLEKRGDIVVQSHAGIGRTGLIICAIAKKLELFAKQQDQRSALLQWVREYIRGAVQTREQEQFIDKLTFAPNEY